MAKEGVKTPVALIPVPAQTPPVGIVIIEIDPALVQNGPTEVMVG